MKSAVKKMENKKKISEISSKSVTWACVCTKKERKRETEYKKKKKASWNKTHTRQCQKLEKESGYTLI